MNKKKLLMIPGPTNVDLAVLQTLARPTLSHTDPDFIEIYIKCIKALRRVFIARGQVFVIAGSGTLALEIAVANVVETGDKVLYVVIGFFGEYFVKISKVHGASSKVLEIPWGKCANSDQIRQALGEDEFKAVTVTHVDTSTGVTNPIKEIGRIVREDSDAFYIVDGVCSLGGMEIRTDDWSIDICASGSQKCIAAPPGLVLLAANDRLLTHLENSDSPIKP